MLILLHGSDTYRSRERLRVLMDAFRKKFDGTGLSTARMDASVIPADRIRSSVVNSGLFSQKRMLVIERLSEAGAGVQEAVVPALEATTKDDAVIVILWESRSLDGPAPRTRSKKPSRTASEKKVPMVALLTSARVEAFPLLTGPALNRWLNEAATTRGFRLTSDATAELIRRMGSDLWSGAGALDKLNAARVGTEVGMELIEAHVPAQVPPSVFALTDAVAARHTDAALAVLEQEFRHGAVPLALLAQLTRQFRTLLLVSESGTATPATLAKNLGIHPYVAQRAAIAAKRFAPGELKARLQELLNLEREFKSSHPNPALLLERFLVRAGAPRPTSSRTKVSSKAAT